MANWPLSCGPETKSRPKFGESASGFGTERHLRNVVHEYVSHYNAEGYHQGLGNIIR